MKNVPKLLVALAHPVFKLSVRNSSEAKRSGKVWKKNNKIDFVASSKNCSEYNEKCMLLEIPIAESKFDCFHRFLKIAYNDSKVVPQ